MAFQITDLQLLNIYLVQTADLIIRDSAIPSADRLLTSGNVTDLNALVADYITAINALINPS